MEGCRRFILRQCRIPITFDRHNIIFGKYKECKKNRIPNLLIYIIKHYIFTCRFKTAPTPIFMDLNFDRKIPVVKNLYI